MNNTADNLPVIGSDISWELLHCDNQSGFLKIHDFSQLAEVKGDKIKAYARFTPYGSVILECLENQSFYHLNICHKIDFLHLHNAFEWIDEPDNRIQAFEKMDLFIDDPYDGSPPDSSRTYTTFWNTTDVEVLIGNFSLCSEGRRLLRTLAGAFLPKLYVWVCPKGFLERFVYKKDSGLTGRKGAMVFLPLVQWKPNF